MPTHIPFPSIEQLRNCIKEVKDTAEYHQRPAPILTFYGTVKLHGTNAAVCCDVETGESWYQSRSNIITPENDNAGFARYASGFNFEIQLGYLSTRREEVAQIAVFGEWCGGNIQSSVALAKLPKMFVIFAVLLKLKDGSDLWLNHAERKLVFVDEVETFRENNVYLIDNFYTSILAIDFNDPAFSQNELIRLTEAVEAECPVARDLGVSGVGEGIVWTCESVQPHLRFKVKGEKHSASKVKVLAAVDTEKHAAVHDFVASVLTESRLQQGLENIPALDMKNIGSFLKWINLDINKEEADTMEANGFTMSDVGREATKVAKDWFLARMKA